MHCRTARKAMLDRDLGLLTEAAASRLEDHLATCAACAAEAGTDAILVRDLAALSRSAPVRVDVTARILGDIDGLGALDRRAVPATQFVWAWVWAYALALTVAIMGVGILVFVPKELPDLGHLSEGLPAAASALAQPFVLLFVGLKGLGRAALELLELFSQLLVTVRPVVQVAMALALAVMAAITALVIGNDLRRYPAALARKEHGR
jgi:hypothetical protein